MVSQNFLACFAETLSHEGLFSNHPLDPGGMTMLGVTRKTWARWTGRKVSEVTEAEMRALTPEKVAPLYHQEYWLTVRGDDLPPGIDMMVFDIAVNSGPRRAILMLQKAINKIAGRIRVAVDGKIGPKTLAAARAANTLALIKNIALTRLWFYYDLSTFRTFGRGWTDRLMDVALDAVDQRAGRAPAAIMAQAA